MKDLKWFAVYTRPKWEKKVTELLKKKNIDAYCPLTRKYKEWGDKKRIVADPLFNSYVFVCIEEREQVKVLQTRGVLSFFYWLGKPAVIDEQEIDAIDRFVNDYTNVIPEKTLVRPNEQVRFTNSPLILRKGNILEVRNSTVKVLLPTLGYTLVAELQKDITEENVYGEDAKIRV